LNGDELCLDTRYRVGMPNRRVLPYHLKRVIVV
jgi:hypothetical protein